MLNVRGLSVQGKYTVHMIHIFYNYMNSSHINGYPVSFNLANQPTSAETISNVIPKEISESHV